MSHNLLTLSPSQSLTSYVGVFFQLIGVEDVPLLPLVRRADSIAGQGPERITRTNW